MDKSFKRIKKILSRLHRLQQEHLASFENEELPDLEKQSAERDHEMDRLMAGITDFVSMAKTEKGSDTKSMMLFVNDQITGLLKQNSLLEAKVKAVKDFMEENMKQVSKGKQVIHSYRSPTAVSKTPRVISITN